MARTRAKKLTDITPLDETIRQARAKGRKRIKVGTYTVSIYPHYCLFDGPGPDFNKETNT